MSKPGLQGRAALDPLGLPPAKLGLRQGITGMPAIRTGEAIDGTRALFDLGKRIVTTAAPSSPTRSRPVRGRLPVFALAIAVAACIFASSAALFGVLLHLGF